MTGVVVKYYKDKGYGFIDSDNKSIFFHVSNIEKHAEEEIELGTKFNFDIGINSKGKQAINIKVIQNEISKFIKIDDDRIKISNIKAYGIKNNSKKYIEYINDMAIRMDKSIERYASYYDSIIVDTMKKEQEKSKQQQQANIDTMKNCKKYDLALKNELIYLYIETYQNKTYTYYRHEIEDNIYDILSKLDSMLNTY